MSPDCLAGKHTACTGDGNWDDAYETVTPCRCECHAVTVAQ